jgi:hypothetical protein
VPTGSNFCITVSYVSGSTIVLDYDKATGSAGTTRATNLVTPQTIYIPEWGLVLVGFALAVPVWLAARRRRAEVAA